MALVDVNPGFVAQACRRIRSYLEEIRAHIEANQEAPIVALDFDALGQLLMPHKRSSGQAGLLWRGVITARQIRQETTASSEKQSGLPAVERLQIPEGARRELRRFCKKLLRDYKDIVQGRSAQKFGVELEDLEATLGMDDLSDDDLGRLVRQFGSVNLSLNLLASLLEQDIELSPLKNPRDKNIRFHDYLARIEMERPEPNKSVNNENDALNLIQTADFRSHGRDAYLVTTTRAVLDSEDRITKEPFFFALELAVRSRFRALTREATGIQLDIMISRLTDVIRNTTEFGSLISTSKTDKRHDLHHEVSVLRQALAALGDDPILRQLSDLLSEEASAMRSTHEARAEQSSRHHLHDDMMTFSKLRSLVGRLRAELGDVPELTVKRKRFSSDHLSYSLLDQQGILLFAADSEGDDLAIAWTTEVAVFEFCSDVVAYYSKIQQPRVITILIRLAGLPEPRTLKLGSLSALAESLRNETQERKVSLLKIVCDDNIFWYDTSALYAFDNPEETISPEPSKVAVSIAQKDQLSQLTDFFLATSAEAYRRMDAQDHFRKLLRMEVN